MHLFLWLVKRLKIETIQAGKTETGSKTRKKPLIVKVEIQNIPSATHNNSKGEKVMKFTRDQNFIACSAYVIHLRQVLR